MGFFSFTEITDPAEHRSYNEWHQLDHMPEQYPLAGMAYGQRWVATPACRAARAVDGELLAPVHYATLYLMTEPVDETLAQFQALGGELRRRGRFHQHRRAQLSGPFVLESVRAAPRALVSAAAVPYRPNRGVYLVVEDRASTDDRPAQESLDELLETAGVAGVWTFASATERRGPWYPGVRRVTVCYLDDEPLGVAASVAAVVRRRPPGPGPVIHAGPYETVTPWQWDWFEAGTPAGTDL